jgi:hypothetical protein
MTTEERLENLERELAVVKRRNRRLLFGAAICLGMIFAWLFFSQPGLLGIAQAEGPTTAPAQDKVRARSFVVQDENGKVRATLTMNKAGPGLVLADENGKTRAVLGEGREGCSLALVDEIGRLRCVRGPPCHPSANPRGRTSGRVHRVRQVLERASWVRGPGAAYRRDL